MKHNKNPWVSSANLFFYMLTCLGLRILKKHMVKKWNFLLISTSPKFHRMSHMSVHFLIQHNNLTLMPLRFVDDSSQMTNTGSSYIKLATKKIKIKTFQTTYYFKVVLLDECEVLVHNNSLLHIVRLGTYMLSLRTSWEPWGSHEVGVNLVCLDLEDLLKW